MYKINNEETNEQTEEQTPFDFASIGISPKAGKNNLIESITQLSIPMSKIVSLGLTDRRKAYANNTLNFEKACIGEKATYSLDSAHKGGHFFRTKDNIVFRFGSKGQIAVQDFIIQNTSAQMPNGE